MKLALQLIGAFILLLLVNLTVPQMERYSPEELGNWVLENPLLASILGPLGLFNVLNSYPFFIATLLLAINTLSCTVVRLIKMGGLPSLKHNMRNVGFLVLHAALLGIFFAGMISFLFKLEGRVLLIEGNNIQDRAESYSLLTTGLLRQKPHTGIYINQKRIENDFQEGKFHKDSHSYIEIYDRQGRMTEGVIRINEPVNYKHLAITMEDVGFAPHLEVRNSKTGEILSDSLMVMRTVKQGALRFHRDYLPHKELTEKIFVTIYPEHRIENGEVLKSGENPVNPILLVEVERQGEPPTLEKIGYIRPNATIDTGSYQLRFKGLRLWNTLLISDDPGYGLAFFSFWLAIIGLLLRYIPDLKNWS